MVFQVPAGLKTWEAAAALIVAQSNDARMFLSDNEETSEILSPVDVEGTLDTMLPSPVLVFDAAYRKVDETKNYYGKVLAETNGLEYIQQARPVLFDSSSEEGGIVFCPFAIKSEMGLPASIWRATVRHLRSYGLPVYLMGDRGQRMREGMLFTENDILCDLPVIDKINALAQARCIVGVPNAWMWLSTAWNKKTMIFYPDSVPERRWWPFVHDDLRFFMYEARAIQIPIFLTAMRRILKQF